MDNSHAILDQFHHLVALIQSGTTAVVDKKDAFSAVGVGRAEAMIQLDLILLRNVVAALDAALVAIAPVCIFPPWLRRHACYVNLCPSPTAGMCG